MGKPVTKVGKKKKKKSQEAVLLTPKAWVLSKVSQGEKVEKGDSFSGKTGKPLEEGKF